MKKLCALVTLCIFTLLFLVIQLMTYGSLSDWNALMPLKGTNLIGRQGVISTFNDLWDSIKEFTEICRRLQINCILIDPAILKHLTERPESYSKNLLDHSDGHKGCHYFCSNDVVTFAIIASDLEKNIKMETLIEQLGERKFKSTVLRGIDDRHESLERNLNQKDLKSHLMFQRRSLFIHIILLHERQDHYWSTTCSFIAPKRFSHFPKTLINSKFCKNQNIISRFTWMSVKMDKLTLTIPKYPVTFLRDLGSSTFLPCNIKRARQFYSKYGVDQSTEADIFRLRAKNLLFTVKYVLDRLGIRFWLSSGTCLGWFRQCDFIPHSKDLDIGIWIKDYNENISKELKKAGLVTKHIFGKVEDSFELSFRTSSNDLKLDIFFFYEEPDHMWNGGTQAKTGKKFKYRFPKFDICWTEFAELFVRVPCNTQSYIEANYGPDWHKVIKEWDWKKSPSNVEEIGIWPKNELKNVVQVFQ